MLGLKNSATVYTAAALTGAYTVAAKSGLKCRLMGVALSAQAASQERAEMVNHRDLLWEPTYAMPDNAQLLIGSDRWNVVNGTRTELYGPLDTIVYRKCELVRAE